VSKKFYFAVFVLLALAFSGCVDPQPGETPVVMYKNRERQYRPQVDRNGNPVLDEDGNPVIKDYPITIVCFVDVENQNPLNAGDYLLEDGGPYFDIVILGSAQIKRPGGPKAAVELFIPPGLQYVLNNRNKYIVPMQRMGIKVVLGITGGQDDISFGNIKGEEDDKAPNPDFYMIAFANKISEFLQQYQLDGVELYDTNAAKDPPDLDTYPYPDGGFEGWPEIDRFPDTERGRYENRMAWGNIPEDMWSGSGGGLQLAVLCKRIRGSSNEYMKKLEETLILVRDRNYGAYIAPEPVVFDFRNAYVNYYISYEYDVFGASRGKQGSKMPNGMEPIPVGGSSIEAMEYNLFGPLSIDLVTVTPPIYDAAGNDIDGFSDLFMEYPKRDFTEEEYYGLIFYNGLMAASDEGDRFRDTRPGSPTEGENLTQADIFSISSEKIMRQKVIRLGGNHQKTWIN